MDEPDLIVFCHIRWDYVYQRPQHLHSRLAATRRVWFIEEPVYDASIPVEAPSRRKPSRTRRVGSPVGGAGGGAFWEKWQPSPGVTVCRPHTPIQADGFHETQMPVLRRLVRDLVVQERIVRYAAWLNTPMAVPLLEVLEPEVIVYDCMDDLSSFLHAPADLPEKEANLMERANLVFTGGPSLYQAKSDWHPHVYCFPSSVDVGHFDRARLGGPLTEAEEPADQRLIPHPRLGYFGVLDERIDLDLLAWLAQNRPDWQFVLIGPVAKIDHRGLPRAANLHYLGMKPYDLLPGYLAGWDACLLPFARNETTRMISPTKTLEYMASERPIVGTPLADVAGPYGDIVYLGGTRETFLEACRRAMAAGPAERSARAAAMREILSRTSWDVTVSAMSDLMARHCRSAAAEPAAVPAAEPAAEPAAVPRGVVDRSSEDKPGDTPSVVILGAGPTGLSAAYHLGSDALLVERNDRVGGWCRSLTDHGFTFDYAGHIMFSNDPYVLQMYDKLLGDNVHWQDREAWIYSKGVYTRYPFQGALYGLPPEVIQQCLVGAIEARFGPLQPAKTTSAAGNGKGNGNRQTPLAKSPSQNHHDASSDFETPGTADGCGIGSKDISLAISPMGSEIAADVSDCGSSCKALRDCCADGILESSVRELAMPQADGASDGSPEDQPRNFEEFIYKVWGAGIAEHFAVPYNRKLWAVDLAEMDTSWLGGRVPLPDLEEMIEGALSPVPKPMGPNARFGYPLRGGFQAMMEGFLPLLTGPLWLNTSAVAVSPSRHAVTFADGNEVRYESLISTVPLPALIRMIGDEAPEVVRKAAAALRHVSVRCVHLGIGRERLTEKHWIYYPEDTVFHRVFVQGNASPYCNPPGGFGLTCEISYSPHKPLPADGQALIDRCVADCHRVGLFNPEDPIWSALQVDMPYAYVVYDHARPRLVARIRRWLESRDIHLAGRYSEWEYYNSDHAFLAGRQAAQRCRRTSEIGVAETP